MEICKLLCSANRTLVSIWMGHWPLDRIIKRRLKVSMFFYYIKKKQSTVSTVEINELVFIELENWQLTWTEDVSNVQPYKWENLVINHTTHSLSSGFSFTTIQESQDCRGRGRVFLWLLTTTSTGFTNT